MDSLMRSSREPSGMIALIPISQVWFLSCITKHPDWYCNHLRHLWTREEVTKRQFQAFCFRTATKPRTFLTCTFIQHKAEHTACLSKLWLAESLTESTNICQKLF